MVTDDFTYLNPESLETLTKEDQQYIEISKQLAKDIKVGKLVAFEAIQKLGSLLTSQSFSRREIGVLILSETLCHLGLDSNISNILNPEQLLVLSSYFTEKLKDHHQVASSALKGILALVSSSNVPSESIIQLVTSIFNHITCQQQQQQDRYLIFQIYEIVLNKHTKDVHSMGIDFVYGVISSIDGERDPKNLMYLFTWLQTFLKTVKLGHLTEEMFEVLACYFPVDFKAPPTDKNKITREDLATSLCQCLTCISDFGPLGIPLALEKLDSALKIAKNDSLDILKNGCKNYETSIYFQHAVEIWSQIQKEIFNTTDVEFMKKCLETLTEMIKKLSQEDQDKFATIINDISDTLKGNLLPDSKLFPQSSQILIHVAQAGEKSSIIVAKKIAPLLENTFKITKNPAQKSVILNTFIAFVKAVIDNNNNIELGSFEEIGIAPLLCSQATLDLDENLRAEGFKGFVEIARFVPENVRKVFFTNLHRLIVMPQKDTVKNSFFRCLKTMSEIFPLEVEEQVLHKEKICEIFALDMYLESISNILEVPHFEAYVIDTIINYILNDISVSKIALGHLNNVLSKNIGIDNILIKKNFIAKLTDFLATLENPDNLQIEFLHNVNLVLQNTVRLQEKLFQKELYSSQSMKSFKTQAMYITVLSGLIIPMQRGAFDDYEKIQFLVDCSIDSTDEFVRNISVEVLANILNKIDNEQILADNLNKIDELFDYCNNTDIKINFLSWLTKSLVTRNYPNAWHWTDKLLHCLDINIDAALGFKIVMDETKPALSKLNYCQIMPLYKQKFFVYVTNKLSENCQISNCEYFATVAYLMESTPKQAVIGQFKKILRLILLCLEKSTEPEVLQIILRKITSFIASGESIIENNFDDIFLRVLNLTTFNTAMEVRVAAIRGVQQFTMTYPVYKLLPYKLKVIQQLGLCVDDRKRLVRKEAMVCRSLWYLLDAPE